MKTKTLLTIAVSLAIVFISFVACADDDNLYRPSALHSPIEGYVKDNSGNPLSGIVVSDGFTIVQTDSKGYYSIPERGAYAYWVYYSIPADVKIEIGNNGRPNFYQKIEPNKSKYDFVLTKQSVEKDFRILAIGDPQVRVSNNGLTRFANETAPDIREYVQSKNNDMPTYAVSMGDLVHNEWGLYKDIFDLLTVESLSVPCFSVIGNHDHEFRSGAPLTDQGSQRLYEKEAGPVNYSFDRGNVHCVVIDNIIFEGKNESALSIGLSSNVDSWLKKDLSMVDRSKSVLIFSHAQMSDTNFPELFTLLAEFAEARIISGHEHSVQTKIYEVSGKEIYMNIVGTTNGVDWKGTVCGDGAPMGYGAFEIKNGKVVNNIYKPVKFPETFQMRMYRSADFPTFSHSIQNGSPISYSFYGNKDKSNVSVNVWNKSSKWTFDVYENGQLSSHTLVKNNMYDCWATYWFYMVKGANTYTYNQRRDHMYYYKMDNPNANLKIVAKDEYGNTFEQTEFTLSTPDHYPDIYR